MAKYSYTYKYQGKKDKAASSGKGRKLVRVFIGLTVGGVFGYIVYENWSTITGAFNNLTNAFINNLTPSASASYIPPVASSTSGGMPSYSGTALSYQGTAQADSSFVSFAQSQAWYPYISTYSMQYNVPASIILGVIEQESGGNPNAVSGIGAIGLMQIMPATAQQVATANGISYVASSSLYIPQTNIAIGTAYLSSLYSQYNDWTTALNAYFAGPNNINNISQITITTANMPSNSTYGQQVMLRSNNIAQTIVQSGSLLSYLNNNGMAT